MQPTNIQVERSLEALSGDACRSPEPSEVDHTIPEGLIERLTDSPAVREERLVDARLRLVGGEQPSDDDLADRVVGRLVCDRLR